MLELLGVLICVVAMIRGRLALSLLILTIYYYTYWFFGANASTLVFYHNLSDVGNILCLFIVFALNLRKYDNGVKVVGIKNGLAVFAIFFLIGLLIDLTINHTPFVSVFKAVRNWIPLTLLLVCHKIKPEEAYRYFQYLIILTFCFSALFLFEYITDTTFTGARRTRGGERASLPWPVAVLAFSFFLYSRMGFTRKFRILFLIVLFLNLIVCGSRSFFISYVVMFFLYYASTSMTIKKALLLVVFAIGMVAVFSTDNILSQRFSESKDDIASVRAGDDEVNGNLSFRLLLTQERLTYISQSVQYAVFGIGQVEERNLETQIFSIGLPNESGGITQLDTGDIAWALAFLRWGIVGTMLYVIAYYLRFVLYFQRRKPQFMARCFSFYLIVELFFVSFTYPEITQFFFWIPPIIGLACVDSEVKV